jgi:starvation-inducible DNA-binding protein
VIGTNFQKRRHTMSTPHRNDREDRREIAAALSRLLADSYTLYLKTHGFHWNVVGPRFYELHKLFEEQYTELQGAVDAIAERVRALGAKAPGSYGEFGKLTSLREESGTPPAQAMIRQLLADNRSVARSAEAAVEAAEARHDVATADLATQRVEIHEKAAWMLDSLLQPAD